MQRPREALAIVESAPRVRSKGGGSGRNSLWEAEDIKLTALRP